MQVYVVQTQTVKVAWDYEVKVGTTVDGFKLYYGDRVRTQDMTKEATLTIPVGDTLISVSAFNTQGESAKSEPIMVTRQPNDDLTLNVPTNVRVV